MSKLTMRELKGDDMFMLLSIIGKLDIKDEFIEMFEENVDNAEFKKPQDFKDRRPKQSEQEEIDKRSFELAKETEKQGMKLMANIMQKFLVKAKYLKSDLNEMLADLTCTSVEEISNLSLMEYSKLIMDFFKKEELKDFFTSIASLI